MAVIQWFPGHMTKAKRMVLENLKLVDVAIELVDARIPQSSRNPMIDELVGSKPRMVILNKADLADPEKTRRWLEVFAAQGIPAIAVDAARGKGLQRLAPLVQELARDLYAKWQAKGMRPRAIRAMILGIPNVGKSSLINRLAGTNRAQTGDKPGVTRGKQWIKVGASLDLLDTPGILWPKFEDQEVALKLSATGAISDLVVDLPEVAVRLIALLQAQGDIAGLKTRYKLEGLPDDPREILQAIGRKRGCMVKGGEIDSLKAATLLLNEFRAGLLGAVTLDDPAVDAG